MGIGEKRVFHVTLTAKIRVIKSQAIARVAKVITKEIYAKMIA